MYTPMIPQWEMFNLTLISLSTLRRLVKMVAFAYVPHYYHSGSFSVTCCTLMQGQSSGDWHWRVLHIWPLWSEGLKLVKYFKTQTNDSSGGVGWFWWWRLINNEQLTHSWWLSYPATCPSLYPTDATAESAKHLHISLCCMVITLQ